jgi:hypothetical protein
MFNTTEKAQVQTVFLIWANAALTGYMHPTPVGVIQDATQLLPGARGVANNYASAHMRQLAYYALSFDAADDPPVDPTLPQVGLKKLGLRYLTPCVPTVPKQLLHRCHQELSSTISHPGHDQPLLLYAAVTCAATHCCLPRSDDLSRHRATSATPCAPTSPTSRARGCSKSTRSWSPRPQSQQRTTSPRPPRTSDR